MNDYCKLTVRERLARTIAAGVLAASMGAAGLSAPLTAIADDGSVTISAVSNAGATYKVYEVFKADIASNSDNGTSDAYPGIATHIEWASEAAKVATLTYLDANGYGQWLAEGGRTAAGAHDLPQNAAEFIASRIGGSDADAGAATTPKTPASHTFALEYAKALKGRGVTAASATAGTTFTAEQGFYLFVTDGESVGDDEAGTAPIWVPLGGKTTTISEKTSIPTVNKQVKEDKTGQFGKAADANAFQDIDYKLTGTLPANIGAFDAYHYKFTDTLSDGLELEDGDDSSVVVMVDSTDVTAKVDIEYKNNVLTVDFPDLLKVNTGTAESPSYVPITKDTVVTVEYKAHVTEQAAMGSAGNENSVVLTYTNDPVSEQDGTTLSTGITVQTYTYQLNLNKVDKQTAESLAQAKYTVQVADTPAGADTYVVDNENGEYYLVDGQYTTEEPNGYDGERYMRVPGSAATTNPNAGKYVQGDGSLGDTAYEFESDDSGNIVVPRIDEGTYIVRETQAPSGYELQDADIVVTISSTLNQTTGSLDNLVTEVSGGEAAPEGQVATHVVATTAATGAADVQTSDDKKVLLPVTGMDGVKTSIILASGVIVVSAAGLIRSRRKGAGEGDSTEQ